MKRHALLLMPLAAAPALAMCNVAHADVTWEHRLSVRLGSSAAAKPIGSVTVRTQWQGTEADPAVAARQRISLRVSPKDFDKLPPLPIPGMGMGRGMDFWAQNLLPGGSPSMHALFPEAPLLSLAGRGLANAARAQSATRPSGAVEAALVTDLANDSFLAYASPKRTSLAGPLRPTLTRVRFNPWKKLAPRLSEEAPPELTRAQRARLGAEVRSTYRPFINDNLKLYFRPLNETRTINGMETRGYRLAALVNMGGTGRPYGPMAGQPEWAQVRVEMWLAPEQDGDALVRSFNLQSRNLRREIGGQSASMWLNEFAPVLWQMMPQQILQAAETLMPPEGASNEGFGGTPVRMHLTVTPPPVQRMAIGETRLDLTLTGRSTAPLEASTFLVPTGYKAEPLEPLLKQFEKSQAQMDAAIEKAMGKPKPKAKKAAPKPKPAM